MLDAAASMASSATFRGILLRAVSGCCYNNGGLRNRRWANAITKHGGKGEWQTSVQTLPFARTVNPSVASYGIEDLRWKSVTHARRGNNVTLYLAGICQPDRDSKPA